MDGATDIKAQCRAIAPSHTPNRDCQEQLGRERKASAIEGRDEGIHIYRPFVFSVVPYPLQRQTALYQGFGIKIQQQGPRLKQNQAPQ